jgi:hypothetical protein
MHISAVNDIDVKGNVHGKGIKEAPKIQSRIATIRQKSAAIMISREGSQRTTHFYMLMHLSKYCPASPIQAQVDLTTLQSMIPHVRQD